MTEIEAQKLVTMLVTAFPHAMTRMTVAQQDATHTVYRRMLLDLDSVAAAAAVERLMATGKWLPTISEIRTAVLDMTVGERRPGGDAWGDVKNAVHRCGRERMPTFADPLVTLVVSRFGWRDFCDSAVEDESSWRARFIQLYDSMSDTTRRDQLTAGLPAVKRLAEQREADRRPKTLSDAITNALDGKDYDS